MNGRISRRSALRTLGAATGLYAVGSLGAGPAASSRYGIVGKQAPDISGTSWIDAQGRPSKFHMSELEGRWVYLKCFQSWCPGCHEYGFPTLKRVLDALAGRDEFVALGLQTVFEGFGINTVDKMREIQQTYSLSIKMGHDRGDPDGDHLPATMRRYRTGGTPWVVIISPERQVIYNDYHIDADRFIEFLTTKIG